MMLTPLVIGEGELLSQNSFCPSVIKNNTICYGMQTIGACRLNPAGRPMQHERCMCTDLSFLSAELSYGGYDGYGGADPTL